MSLNMVLAFDLEDVHGQVAVARRGSDDLAHHERPGNGTERTGVTRVGAVVAQHEVAPLGDRRTRDGGGPDLTERRVVPTGLLEDPPVDVDALAHRPDRLTGHP